MKKAIVAIVLAAIAICGCASTKQTSSGMGSKPATKVGSTSVSRKYKKTDASKSIKVGGQVEVKASKRTN
mgnify:CR=1 FL=1